MSIIKLFILLPFCVSILDTNKTSSCPSISSISSIGKDTPSIALSFKDSTPFNNETQIPKSLTFEFNVSFTNESSSKLDFPQTLLFASQKALELSVTNYSMVLSQYFDLQREQRFELLYNGLKKVEENLLTNETSEEILITEPILKTIDEKIKDFVVLLRGSPNPKHSMLAARIVRMMKIVKMTTGLKTFGKYDSKLSLLQNIETAVKTIGETPVGRKMKGNKAMMKDLKQLVEVVGELEGKL